MWAASVGLSLPLYWWDKGSRAVAEAEQVRTTEQQAAESVRQLLALRTRERHTALAAVLEALEVYRHGLLVQSDATVRSTLFQYRVGKVPFASVLEVMRGLVADEGGYLSTLADAERLLIALREVSLQPPSAAGVASSGAAHRARRLGTERGANLFRSGRGRRPRLRTGNVKESSMSTRRFGPLVLAIAMVLGLAAGVAARRSSSAGRPPRDRLGGAAARPHHLRLPDAPEHHLGQAGRVPHLWHAAGRGGRTHRHAEQKLLFYRSPMDPKVTSPSAAQGRDGDGLRAGLLRTSWAAAQAIGGRPGHGGHRPAAPAAHRVAHRPGDRGPGGGSWRTVGRVAVDETRVAHVSLKFSGFIEHVFVDYIGKQVRAGEPLFSIYSPDVVSAEEEYLLALRTAGLARDWRGPGRRGPRRPRPASG